MKVVKLALLGTAALAAVSVSARADDLADLKAQIEALNGRISQLESTPSVPAGYQLLTVSETDAIIVPGIDPQNDKDFGKKATNIGVMPTADVPASTNIQWSGFVRAGLVYRDRDWSVDRNGDGDSLDPGEAAFDSDQLDLVSRAGLKVVGTTDTAVGEVGVRVVLLASVETRGGVNRSHDSSVATDGYWGWWQITPELMLAGGVDGSLANSSNLFDNRCTCAYIDTGGGFGHNDPTQVRLTYASGPISFAIAVEDEGHGAFDTTVVDADAFGAAAELKWTGDSVGFDLNAGYFAGSGGAEDDWNVNAGANFSLGDIASVGLGVGIGETNHIGDDFVKGGVFLGFNLSDAVKAELGVTYLDADVNELTVAGGLYYTPVAQLTLGAEASYLDLGDAGSGDQVTAALISIWRF
jgi:hypothetical protein